MELYFAPGLVGQLGLRLYGGALLVGLFAFSLVVAVGFYLAGAFIAQACGLKAACTVLGEIGGVGDGGGAGVVGVGGTTPAGPHSCLACSPRRQESPRHCGEPWSSCWKPAGGQGQGQAEAQARGRASVSRAGGPSVATEEGHWPTFLKFIYRWDGRTGPSRAGHLPKMAGQDLKLG